MSTDCIDTIALSVIGYASYANGDMSRDQMVDELAKGEIGEWVYQVLAGEDRIILDRSSLLAVQRLVASAMLRQQAYDEKMEMAFFEGSIAGAEPGLPDRS